MNVGDRSAVVQVDRIVAACQSRSGRGREAKSQKSGAPKAEKPQKLPSQRAASTVAEKAAAAEAREVARVQARARVIEKFSKKKPAYSNCRMLAQDGSQLAACDLKKICWYVEKGLAEWVDGHSRDSPQPTIRLNFQHKTTDQLRGVDAGYYFEVKRNQCVGCGEGSHYLKYRCALHIAVLLYSA